MFMKIKNYSISILVFFIFLGCSFVIIRIIQNKQINEQQITASNLIAGEALTIKNQLDRALSSVYGIAAVIKENNGKIDNFKSIAKIMMDIINNIDSINIAPDLIIQDVYPNTDNPNLIGINILKISERTDDIYKTINSKKLTLGGPYSLIEGGVGLIGRYPVFIQNQLKEEVFWGLVTVTINLDSFINSIGLRNLDTMGYAYELYNFDDKNNEKMTILANHTEKMSDPINIKIVLPNNYWYLSIAPLMGWSTASTTIFLPILMLFLSTILSILTFYLLIQPEILRKKIKLATLELTEKNKKLEEETHNRIEKERLLSLSEKLASLGKLSTAITHEIRQPLNSIKILTDGVLFWHEENQNLSYEEFLEYFKNISRLADKIDDIIKNLRLMINAPEKIASRPVNINDLIREVLTVYQQKLLKHNIQLTEELDASLQDIILSDGHFHPVIINLLDNAICALDKTKKKLKKIIIKTEERKKSISFSISDNGPGIPKENKNRIFEPFFSTNQENEGMGMGLYLVKNILNISSADIFVDDNEMGGTTFTIILKRTVLNGKGENNENYYN